MSIDAAEKMVVEITELTDQHATCKISIGEDHTHFRVQYTCQEYIFLQRVVRQGAAAIQNMRIDRTVHHFMGGK